MICLYLYIFRSSISLLVSIYEKNNFELFYSKGQLRRVLMCIILAIGGMKFDGSIIELIGQIEV